MGGGARPITQQLEGTYQDPEIQLNENELKNT
jgi:hypothetical protein